MLMQTEAVLLWSSSLRYTGVAVDTTRSQGDSICITIISRLVAILLMVVIAHALHKIWILLK